MRVPFLLLVTLAFACLVRGETALRSTAPSYSIAGIVNSATYTAEALAPGSIASIYGSYLSYDTGSAADHMRASALPNSLAGVRVFVAGLAAPLYYVSPQQINFLIPGDLRPGDMDLFIAREGTAGPHVRITVHDIGPGLYQWEPGMIAATYGDGRIITTEAPARPGDIVVLYGTGLGRTDPDVISAEINMAPAQIVRLSDLRVLVNGTAVEQTSITYAGVTPGIPGLYQVNVKLPVGAAPDPEIRIAIGDRSSPAAVKLPVRQ